LAASIIADTPSSFGWSISMSGSASITNWSTSGRSTDAACATTANHVRRAATVSGAPLRVVTRVKGTIDRGAAGERTTRARGSSARPAPLFFRGGRRARRLAQWRSVPPSPSTGSRSRPSLWMKSAWKISMWMLGACSSSQAHASGVNGFGRFFIWRTWTCMSCSVLS